MKKAIKRLTNIQSEVACHYFVKNNGDIITLVPDTIYSLARGMSPSGRNINF